MNGGRPAGLAALALLVLAAAMPVTAAPLQVFDTSLSYFRDVTFSTASFDECPGGRLVVTDNGRGFEFRERDQGSDSVPTGLPPGFFAHGCATVEAAFVAPPGLESVKVRFEASRSVTPFEGAPAAELLQTVRLLDAEARVLHEHHVFGGREGDQPMQARELPAFDGDFGSRITVQWRFVDAGTTQGGTSTPFSGQAFSAMVRDAVVELRTGANATTSSQASRDGTLVTNEHRVRLNVPTGEQPALHVRVGQGIDFYGIVTPSGELLRDVSTQSDGVLGYDQAQTTLGITGGSLDVTFPRTLVALHGPGEYTFVFRDTGGVHVVPALMQVAGILLFAPLPFAVLAWIESRGFRREAFGRYAASARNLQWGVVLVLLYYAAVVLSAAAGGRIDLMAVWPMPLEGWLLHAQVLLAGVAFTVLWLVARELYFIVHPPRAETDPVRAG